MEQQTEALQFIPAARDVWKARVVHARGTITDVPQVVFIGLLQRSVMISGKYIGLCL